MNEISFENRIKRIIALAGNADKLANSAGVSPSLIGKYLSGKTDPTRKKLIALADAANVNIEWLATGNGPMRKGEKEIIDLELLGLIIAWLDYHEETTNEKISSTKKSIIIIYTYVQNLNADMSSDQARFALMDIIKGNYNLFSSFDSTLDTKEGQEQAIRTYERILKEVFTREGALQAAEALIGAKLLRQGCK